MIGFILTLLIVGLIAGFIARALVPGDDSMSIAATIVLGIIGSFVAGFIVKALFNGDDDFSPAGVIGSILGAVLVLVIYNAVTGRKRHTLAR